MDFDTIAAKLVKPNMEWQAGSSRVDTNETLRKAVRKALRAAFAAGREAMRSECAGAMDELCAKYLGNAAACVNKSDTRTALDMADAFDRASIAIRALPGKEA